MFANKSALFAIAAAFMLLATVEAAPLLRPPCKHPLRVSLVPSGQSARAVARVDTGAILTSAPAPKLADPETSHKSHTTSTPRKAFGSITSVVD
ncbi:MAG: hypothetical protein BYD32DRAFT_463275 [Podila humilis]|nr:MAG: hypothetical protein BYD32DRAFT_463275 [Podila humilis]